MLAKNRLESGQGVFLKHSVPLKSNTESTLVLGIKMPFQLGWLGCRKNWVIKSQKRERLLRTFWKGVL